MKYEAATIFITLLGLAAAAPLVEREVPQEHSHEEILAAVDKSLKLDNPDKIVNSVFGLLGDTAAAQGSGNIKNLDCLQRSIADRAFTNEKKAGNIDGMANALIFAALEKNTGAVGKASNTCNDPAENQEINAISQHQDPAGTGAKESNKKIVLALAVQLSAIGADPQLAAKSATFAPGKLGDPTAAGNTCDDQDDKVGCIFTKKLIQVEATPDEIDAAVKDAGGKKEKREPAGDDKATGNNVQAFTGSLGGPPPAVIETKGNDRPFTVKSDTFVGKSVALQRSCSIQHNTCADAANSGGGFSVSDCEAQEAQCNAANAQPGTKRSVKKRGSKRSIGKRHNKRSNKHASRRANKRANKRSIAKRAVAKPDGKSTVAEREVAKPGN